MHRLSTLSLSNRSFIALVSVVVTLLGAMSMLTLRQELIPSVALPQIQIVTTSPGSSPEQVHDRISVPVENAVRGLEHVEKTDSRSQSSLSMVKVELTYGTDDARSANQIEAAINRIKDQLPEGAEPQVISGGTGSIPAAVLSVSSDLAPSALAERLDSSVVPELEKIDGVSGVILAGAPEQIVRITPDEKKLAEHGLGTDAIATALDDSGLSVPGGKVADGDRSLDVAIGQELSSVKDLESIVLMPPKDAAEEQGQDRQGRPAAQGPVALKDVAKVEKTDKEITTISRTNGRESLVLVIQATADGNVVDVSEKISAKLEALLPGVGGSAESDVVFDQAPFIQDSIVALAEEGLLGLVFAVGVILLFLLAIRPTIVTAISIPLSLLMAFIGMLVSGYTLNMLTLAALTISIGRVVDDSIVVIENITRHLTYGKTRMRAITDAVREVAGAVTSSTLATVIVFLPIAVVSGMAGELFRPFALTVAIAMLSSLLVALTIVPVLAYWFLRPPKAARGIDPEDPAAVARVHEAAEEKEQRGRLARAYVGSLRWVLRHRILTLLGAIGVLVGTVALIASPLLKVNFLGSSGENLASYTQTLKIGTSLEETSQKAAEAEKALQEIDGVQTVQTTIGADQFGLGAGSNEITYQVTTDPDADQEALGEKMIAALRDLPGAGEVEDAMSAGGPSATGSNTVDVQVTAPSPEDRQQAVDALMAQLDPKPASIAEVTTDLEGEQPTARITVDRMKAAERGLTEKAVVGLVAQQLFPGAIGQITIGDTELDIFVEQGKRPETFAQLKELKIAGFPLREVASIQEVAERPTIITKDAQETATVSVTPAGDDVGAATQAVNRAIEKADLPSGARTSIGGAAADIGDTFDQLYIALAAAVLLTYVLLVWIFKSLVQPLVLLVSIPFAATGSFGLLILTGVPLGLPSMIGLLMLIGIVVTNAIVLIDLVNQLRARGMALDEAIVAGARKRLRPILMTAAATIFALTPMALGITGNGGFISQPLAVVVIGGLISSTLLTLLIVPVLYRITEGRGEKRRLREEAAAEERRRVREERERAASVREERQAREAAHAADRDAQLGRRGAVGRPAPAASATAPRGGHGRRAAHAPEAGAPSRGGVLRRLFRRGSGTR